MNAETPLLHADGAAQPNRWAEAAARHWPVLAGAAALAIPTMAAVGRQAWSTEQGAHGPIVLATGLWLAARESAAARAVARPGGRWTTCLLLLPALAAYVLARVTGILELEGPAMYAGLVAALYALAGGAAVRLLWFPLVYLLFVFPPPDTLLATLTQPLKIGLSRAAVDLLSLTGMPIARTGVIIQVAQYDVLVAAACAGLNSIISLSAIGLFYIYVRHGAHWRYAALLMLVIVPVAVFSNFVRVLLLILITYWFGDAAAQGFIHEFAGLVMFVVALGTIMAVDAGLRALRGRPAEPGR